VSAPGGLTSRSPRPAGDGRARGLAAAALGGVLLSFDVPLLKLSGADLPTMVTIRGVMLFSALLVYWFVVRRPSGQPFVNGYTAVAIAVLSALINLSMLTAIHYTSVANVVFILAFNPLFGALIAFVVLKERPEASTIVAIVAAVAGVALIVADGLVSGAWPGDLLALLCALLLGVMLTVARASRTDQSLSPAFGGLLSAAVMAPFASPLAPGAAGLGLLAANGLLVMPLAAALLVYAPRYAPAAVVGMFYLLETALTPLWMWLIFAQGPSAPALWGGLVIVAALAGDGVWRLLRKT
jgi:drug/metabolite transporter (DMT)-like permease